MTDSLWLELFEESSIEIIKQASWWTAERLIWGLFVIISIALLMAGWILALHKTVARQTGTIGRQIERESVLNERQRIARELHDTLEQGLTALSLQLGRLMNKIRKSAPDDLPIVEKAVNALRVCQEESRASIKDLRGGLLEKVDLPTAVKQTVESLRTDAKVGVELNVEGDVQRLSLFVEHQIARILTEAAMNSLHHAQPSIVVIEIRYMSGQLYAEVQDNGRGFDPESLSESGRFGVLGMQERAKRINSELTIQSVPGGGTIISLTVAIDDKLLETRNE